MKGTIILIGIYIVQGVMFQKMPRCCIIFLNLIHKLQNGAESISRHISQLLQQTNEEPFTANERTIHPTLIRFGVQNNMSKIYSTQFMVSHEKALCVAHRVRDKIEIA
jgi:hypothetical protein